MDFIRKIGNKKIKKNHNSQFYEKILVKKLFRSNLKKERIVQ